jgi:exonuclease SbcD
MKKQIALFCNDLHLKEDNIEQIKLNIKELIDYSVKNNTNRIFLAGDIFDSRISQRQKVLNSFLDCLDYCREKKKTIIAIPGNHDKTIYESEDSFLDPYKEHPSLRLIKNYEYLETSPGIYITLIPFFIENVWIEKFKHIQTKIIQGSVKNILLTHMGFEGSMNNDGTKVDNILKRSMFKDFDLVLSGHYHNYQKIGENIHHLPSIYQSNFGEDNNKGFTVLYDDLSFDILKTTFDEFLCIKINLNEFNKTDLPDLLLEYKQIPNLRFQFIGNDVQLKSIDKEELISKGIDVKFTDVSVELNNTEHIQNIKKMSTSDVLKEFEEFCTVEGISVEEGKQFIK